MSETSQTKREANSEKQFLTNMAANMLEQAFKEKTARAEMTLKAEAQYFNKVPRRIKGRINAPLPIMSGFVDTLQSKIDDPPVIKIGHTELADLKKAKKVSAALRVDSAPDKGMWDIKDLLTKGQAIFWGRGFFKYFAESDPQYTSHLETPDPADMAVFNKGGWNLENHRFAGEANIKRSRWEIKNGERANLYDPEQVTALLAASNRDETSGISEEEDLRRKRLQNMGVMIGEQDFDGQEELSLAEAVLEWKGKRKYLLFDPKTKIWLRVDDFSDVTKSELLPWVSYATHMNAWNFWSKASVDDVYPIADLMRVVLMEGIHNLRKRTSGMRAVDSSIFPDISKLRWGPDKTIFGKAMDKGKQLSQGVFEFQTEDNTAITINLIDYLNSLMAQKTGVSSETQGQSEESRVGIAFLNVQQAADRFNLINKYYRHAWTELGKRYAVGLKEHMTEDVLVEMIGTQGVEYEKLTREDLNTKRDFSFEIVGGSAEAEADAIKKQQKADSLGSAVSSYPDQFNPSVTSEMILRNGGWEEVDIKLLMNTDSTGDEMLISEAEQTIQEILDSKKELSIPFNRRANRAFLTHFMDFVADNEIEEKHRVRIEEYFAQHVEQAEQNERRVARAVADAPAGNVEVPSEDGAVPVAEADPATAAASIPPTSSVQRRAQEIAPVQ